jgi:hypothetical protein
MIMRPSDGRPRTFCYMQGPTWADPSYEYPLYEYDPSNKAEVSVNYKTWSGWRAKLVTWLIAVLLPEPQGIYAGRSHRVIK